MAFQIIGNVPQRLIKQVSDSDDVVKFRKIAKHLAIMFEEECRYEESSFGKERLGCTHGATSAVCFTVN